MLLDPTGANVVMSLLQAANYLGIPGEVLEGLVQSRMVPFTKVGERVLFSKLALDHWVYAKSMENLSEDLPAIGFQGLRGL